MCVCFAVTPRVSTIARCICVCKCKLYFCWKVHFDFFIYLAIFCMVEARRFISSFFQPCTIFRKEKKQLKKKWVWSERVRKKELCHQYIGLVSSRQQQKSSKSSNNKCTKQLRVPFDCANSTPTFAFEFEHWLVCAIIGQYTSVICTMYKSKRCVLRCLHRSKNKIFWFHIRQCD